MHRTLTDTFLTKLVTSVNEYLEVLTVGQSENIKIAGLLAAVLCGQWPRT